MTVLRIQPRPPAGPRDSAAGSPPVVEASVVALRPDPFAASDLSTRLQRAIDGVLPAGHVTFGAVVLCLPDHEGRVQGVVLRPPVVRGGTDDDLSPLLAKEMRGTLYSALLRMLGKAEDRLRSGILDRLYPDAAPGKSGPDEGGTR